MILDNYEPLKNGSTSVLRYVLTDGRIEMAWPCIVVEDSEELVVLFIPAGTKYKADPKRTAAEKRAFPSGPAPTGEFTWTKDTLRIMLPKRMHSVLLFWDDDDERSFSQYYVNIEEPFRRSSVGFDTQDLTLDLVVQPNLSWSWKDEGELENHINEGFFTEELASAAREEGLQVVEEINQAKHPAFVKWAEWKPSTDWDVPIILENWASAPPTFWHRQSWAYGVKN